MAFTTWWSGPSAFRSDALGCPVRLSAVCPTFPGAPIRTSRPTLRRLTGGLAAFALAATLTACGGSEPDAADDPAPASSSSTAATAEPTAETSEATEPTEDVQEYDDGGQVDPDKFVARLQAGLAKTKYAHIEFTMGGAGGEMTGSGDVDYTATPPNMQMSMELGAQSVGMLLVE